MTYNIADDTSNIPAVALVRQGSDVATIATRDVLYTKAGGLYLRQADGTIKGPYIQASDVAAEITGAIKLWPLAAAPAGYLLCDGSPANRATFAALFALIGITYGAGNGTTTFNVPDLRGRVPVGFDNMGGTSANRVTAAAADTLNGSAGAETHTLAESEMPLHGHPFRYDPSANGSSDPTGGMMLNAAANTNAAAFTGTPAATAGQQIGGTGGGAAHNNVQPYLALAYIIKT